MSTITEDTLLVFDPPADGHKKVTVDFEVVVIASSGGLVLSREAEGRVDWTEKLAGCIRDWGNGATVVDTVSARRLERSTAWQRSMPIAPFGTDRVGQKTAMGAIRPALRSRQTCAVLGSRWRLAAARGRPLLGREEVRPLAESMNFIAQLEPILPGQRKIVGLVSPSRDAGPLRDDKRVDVRVSLVVAPRPDMAQGARQDEVRVRPYLGREVAVRDGGLVGSGLDKHGKSVGGDLLQSGHGVSSG